MLHNDVAQQRTGEQPASAPKTSQKSPRAQTPAKFKILTLKQADSRYEDIDEAGLRGGSEGTTRIIHIYGRHSPPTSGQLTTHATRQRLQHQKGLTTSPRHEPMLLPQPARHHSFGEGHVQARSVFGPELGTEQQQPAEAKIQHSQSPTNPAPRVHAPTTTCTTPSLRGRTRAGLLGLRT